MANQGPELPRLEGGGTSQAARRLAALDPDFVRVDERTPRDLAEFARQYARELHYFDLANQRAGSWDRFLDPALDLDELTALLNGDPEQAIPAGAGPRPHVALFLTFLKLLQHAQGDVNALTRRHLDFYYRTVLGLQKGEPSADRVNVLFEPAAGVGQVVVPKGALLDGGPDSTDTRQVYRTDRDIVVGRERVGQLAAVYVDKRVTGIREARERHTGTNEEAYLRMFETALGDPAPGDRLRNYPTGVAVDFVLLKKLGDAVRFCRTTTGLALELFELRALIRFLRRRVAGAEWVRVNRALQRVGRTRDPAFVLTPADRDFDANLARALGAAPNFDGITLVETIDDVYEQRHRGRVRTFITTDLRFSSVAAFEQMMRLKFTVDNEWTEVNRLLEIAGGRRRQASDYTLATRSPSAFEENLAEALPGLTFPNGAADIDAYYVDIVRLETFFFMSAEDFGFVMSLFGRTPPPIEVEWLRAYAGLAAAHGQQVYATRRMQLDAVRRGARARPPIDRLDAVFHFPLGETVENGESAPLTRLEPFVSNDDDKDFLVGVQATVEERPRASVPWDKVIRIVERAQRQREGLPVPVPFTEEWLNVYPTRDVTTARSSMTDDSEELPRWRTFGQQPPPVTSDNIPAPSIGWAITSPLLVLAEGERTVEIQLGLAPGSFDAEQLRALFPASPSDAPTVPQPDDTFQIEVSTEEGWVEPDAALVVVETRGNTTTLRVTLRFGVEVAPLVAPVADSSGMDSVDPTIRVMLRQIWDEDEHAYRIRYPQLHRIVIAEVVLAVSVRGITTPRVQSDEGPLDPKKPFAPFGARPAVGSRFHVAHPELVGKPIRQVAFHVEWMGTPPALETAGKNGHYANYKGQGAFLIRISALDNRLEVPLGDSIRLFDARDAARSRTLSVATDAIAARTGDRGARGDPAVLDESDLRTWRRFFTWELTPRDFHHGQYPRLAATKATALAAAIAAAGRTEAAVATAEYQVNPPYTPTVKRLLLDYTASVSLDLTSSNEHRGDERLLHVHPFGNERVRWRQGPHAGWPFLPRYEEQGELYIGLEHIDPKPGRTRRVSILFQMAEGSADPNLAAVQVRWSRLDAGQWVSLDDGQVLSDTTRGFINSGIVEVELGPVGSSTRLDSGLYWLRASIARNASSVCDTVEIQTQAVSATFVDAGNAADHYDQPLPAESIAGLVEPVPDVGTVRQPYTSYGGQTEERDGVFYNRVSERLRHKDRAVTPWDYERLVLDRFPEIYKVKCIPGAPADAREDLGRVDVVVIPDVRNRRPFDPFEPKAPADLIADIETYLAARMPTHAVVRVKNPRYVQVRLRVGVRFREMGNEGYYIRRLNDELNRFLSPWAYGGGDDIIVGGRIYANSIIDFLDRRPYVDYVSHLMLFTSDDGRTFRRVHPSETEGFFVDTTRPDGVLVAARQHEIDLVSETGYEEDDFLGIGHMRVELDFAVAAEPA